MKGKRTIPMLAMMMVIAMILSSPSLAQQGTGWQQSRNWKTRSTKSRVYDPETVQTISGTVVGVEKIRPTAGLPYGVHLFLQTEAETLSVHLGPSWFIEEQDMIITRGDKLSITGSMISFEGREAIIATALTKDGRTLQLRGESGIPLWSGWRKNYRGTRKGRNR